MADNEATDEPKGAFQKAIDEADDEPKGPSYRMDTPFTDPDGMPSPEDIFDSAFDSEEEYHEKVGASASSGDVEGFDEMAEFLRGVFGDEGPVEEVRDTIEMVLGSQPDKVREYKSGEPGESFASLLGDVTGVLDRQGVSYIGDNVAKSLVAVLDELDEDEIPGGDNEWGGTSYSSGTARDGQPSRVLLAPFVSAVQQALRQAPGWPDGKSVGFDLQGESCKSLLITDPDNSDGDDVALDDPDNKCRVNLEWIEEALEHECGIHDLGLAAAAEMVGGPMAPSYTKTLVSEVDNQERRGVGVDYRDALEYTVDYRRGPIEDMYDGGDEETDEADVADARSAFDDAEPWPRFRDLQAAVLAWDKGSVDDEELSEHLVRAVSTAVDGLTDGEPEVGPAIKVDDWRVDVRADKVVAEDDGAEFGSLTNATHYSAHDLAEAARHEGGVAVVTTMALDILGVDEGEPFGIEYEAVEHDLTFSTLKMASDRLEQGGSKPYKDVVCEVTHDDDRVLDAFADEKGVVHVEGAYDVDGDSVTLAYEYAPPAHMEALEGPSDETVVEHQGPSMRSAEFYLENLEAWAAYRTGQLEGNAKGLDEAHFKKRGVIAADSFAAWVAQIADKCIDDDLFDEGYSVFVDIGGASIRYGLMDDDKSRVIDKFPAGLFASAVMDGEADAFAAAAAADIVQVAEGTMGDADTNMSVFMDRYRPGGKGESFVEAWKDASHGRTALGTYVPPPGGGSELPSFPEDVDLERLNASEDRHVFGPSFLESLDPTQGLDEDTNDTPEKWPRFEGLQRTIYSEVGPDGSVDGDALESTLADLLGEVGSRISDRPIEVDVTNRDSQNGRSFVQVDLEQSADSVHEQVPQLPVCNVSHRALKGAAEQDDGHLLIAAMVAQAVAAAEGYSYEFEGQSGPGFLGERIHYDLKSGSDPMITKHVAAMKTEPGFVDLMSAALWGSSVTAEGDSHVSLEMFYEWAEAQREGGESEWNNEDAASFLTRWVTQTLRESFDGFTGLGPVLVKFDDEEPYDMGRFVVECNEPLRDLDADRERIRIPVPVRDVVEAAEQEQVYPIVACLAADAHEFMEHGDTIVDQDLVYLLSKARTPATEFASMGDDDDPNSVVVKPGGRSHKRGVPSKSYMQAFPRLNDVLNGAINRRVPMRPTAAPDPLVDPRSGSAGHLDEEPDLSDDVFQDVSQQLGETFEAPDETSKPKHVDEPNLPSDEVLGAFEDGEIEMPDVMSVQSDVTASWESEVDGERGRFRGHPEMNDVSEELREFALHYLSLESQLRVGGDANRETAGLHFASMVAWIAEQADERVRMIEWGFGGEDELTASFHYSYGFEEIDDPFAVTSTVSTSIHEIEFVDEAVGTAYPLAAAMAADIVDEARHVHEHGGNHVGAAFGDVYEPGADYRPSRTYAMESFCEVGADPFIHPDEATVHDVADELYEGDLGVITVGEDDEPLSLEYGLAQVVDSASSTIAHNGLDEQDDATGAMIAAVAYCASRFVGNHISRTHPASRGDGRATGNQGESTQEQHSHATTNEDNAMSNGNFEEILEHIKHGAESGAVDEASDAILDLFKAPFDDEEVVESILSSDVGREGAKLTTALGLHYLCTAYPNMAPTPKRIKKVAGLVVENATRNLLAPRFGAIREKLEDIADIAEDVDLPGEDGREAQGHLEGEVHDAEFSDAARDGEKAKATRRRARTADERNGG